MIRRKKLKHISNLKEAISKRHHQSRFPTGVSNMGGSSKFDGGLKSKHGGAWGELKMLSKIPVKEFI